MRVQNPDQYAATLLNITMPNERYTPEKIRSMYGRSEIDLKFPTPIPVNITYQTAFVDDAGKLQIRKDIYGRDAAMIGAAQEQPQQGPGDHGRACAAELFASDRLEPAGRRQLRQRQHLSSGPSFFERLFGGPSTATPPAPVGRRAAAAGSPGNPDALPRARISEQNQRSRLSGEIVYVNHYPSRFRHRALFRHSRRVRLSLTWGRDGKPRLTLPL